MQESANLEAKSGEMEEIEKKLEKKFSNVKDNEIMQKLLEIIKKHKLAWLSDHSNGEGEKNAK